MADTRAVDREQIGTLIKSSKNTRERERAKEALHKINSESKKVNLLRGKLIQAVRNKDIRAVKRFESEIRRER